ncbi:MAG: hypothetical protein K2X81_17215 [Candidatus Obscuribacterales bacterium]|nr:hypothetical protein [Candidatus Obscuribacterales bacterium]
MRLETDGLGQLEIADNKLYGVQTARAIACVSFSGSRLADYPDLIKNLALVKKAAAAANADAKSITDKQAQLITLACDELIKGKHPEQFPVDMLHGGGYIAINQNINELIANLANLIEGQSPGSYSPVHPKEHVNCGQSTADVCHTAVRLTVRNRADSLLESLNNIVFAFALKKMQFGPIITLARTCLQDAMPVSLGDTFSAYESFVRRRIKSLSSAIELASKVNLGGTVIGNGDGASAIYRQKVLLHLSTFCKLEIQNRENLFDAAQNIDDLATVSSELRILAEGLIKISKDLRLLSSGPKAGFGEIRLPATQEGSSFFPGKVNPVIPETLIHACIFVLGADRVVQAAFEHAELNLNVLESSAAKALLDALSLLKGSIDIFVNLCVNDIDVNHVKCAANVASLKSK